MANIELYINDRLVDLTDQQAIAMTFQVNDLANLKDRQSTFSNLIELPKTQNNKKIFGFSDSANFNSDIPYRYLSCRYVVNGYEVIPRGNATIQEAGSKYKVQLTYGLKGFAELVGDMTVSDVINTLTFADLSNEFPYNARTLTNVVNSQSATEGIVWPIIDYGYLTNSEIQINDLFPAVYTKTVFKLLQAYTGYQFTGNIISSVEYQRELVPFSGDVYRDTQANDNMPTMKAIDFLKDFMQRYFLVPVVDNYRRVINFFTYSELYDNKQKALDWTDKFVNVDDTLTFTAEQYGRINSLLFREDESLSDDKTLRTNLGSGSFDINNETLQDTSTAVTSIFSGSLQRTDYGALFPAIIKKNRIGGTDATVSFEIATQPRILVDRKTVGNITFRDGQNTLVATTVSVPYFKLSGSPGAGYDEHLTRYGYGLVRLMQNYKKISRNVLLRSSDVSGLDFSLPVFDGNSSSYYYVNKISNWMPGKVCTAELMKL